MLLNEAHVMSQIASLRQLLFMVLYERRTPKIRVIRGVMIEWHQPPTDYILSHLPLPHPSVGGWSRAYSLPLFRVVRLSSTVRTYHDDLQGNPVNVVAALIGKATRGGSDRVQCAWRGRMFL
jgi:hypothetical protein